MTRLSRRGYGGDMQESPILAFIKIVLGTVLALLLFLFFLQRDDEQEKMVKVAERVDSLGRAVGEESNRQWRPRRTRS